MIGEGGSGSALRLRVGGGGGQGGGGRQGGAGGCLMHCFRWHLLLRSLLKPSLKRMN